MIFESEFFCPFDTFASLLNSVLSEESVRLESNTKKEEEEKEEEVVEEEEDEESRKDAGKTVGTKILLFASLVVFS